LDFVSSHNKVSKNNKSNNIADDTGNRRKRKNFTHTAPKRKKRVQLKTGENTEINIVQRESESCKITIINM